MEEVCQQQMPKSSSYRLNGTHYYSTSSGGSLNGHTSIQKNRSEQIAHQKMSKTAEKKI
jgi:hypothetical protein